MEQYLQTGRRHILEVDYVQFQFLIFKFQFQVSILSFNFKFQFQVSISSFNFKFQFQVLISSFNFKGPVLFGSAGRTMSGNGIFSIS